MKRDCEDSVGSIESFLYAVPMMNIDVDIENTRVNPDSRKTREISVSTQTILPGNQNSPQKFENSQDNIIDVTEPTRFRLFRMMQPSAPIDSDIRAPDR